MPIFKYLGESYSERKDMNGKYSRTIGYQINYDAYGEFTEYAKLEFGFVVSAVSVTGYEPLTVENGMVVAKNKEKTIVVSQNSLRQSIVDLKLSGLHNGLNGYEFVMSMYACDGSSITYLNDILKINID